MNNIIIGSIQKFISIVDNEIQLINNIPIGNKPIKIISFIGNARTGKSTLMNCYISNKVNENIKKFNTANRCTTGIDMLLVDTSTCNLILLDVQGL
jgi:ABC-type phosphate transport system ATPase subunit